MQEPGTRIIRHSPRPQGCTSGARGSPLRTRRSPERGFPGVHRVAERGVRGLPSLPMSTPQCAQRLSCTLAQVK
jgi:hypothetical protein